MAGTIEHGSPKRIHCRRCGMSFRVELPRSKAASWTRCAEPKCGRRFWHSIQKPGGPVICGVDPNEFEHRCPGGERATDSAPAPIHPGLCDASLITTPAPADRVHGREPAAFCRGGE
jgi:hypothetical protein